MSTLVTIPASLTRRTIAGFVVRRLQKISDSIDRSPAWAFLALTVFYAAVVGALSRMKLLWLDELITLHIARLGSVHAIWQALARGADPNPPLTHVLVHGSMRLFGEREWALRLPAMVGYWVGMLSLFWFLRRRVPAVWALGAVLLSMSMAAFEYSYESRSYGVFYGLCMLAFACWARAVDPAATVNARRMALSGMILALAAGISTSYMAVLAFLPIAGGELVRALRSVREGRWQGLSARHSMDKRIWAAMLVAAIPMIVYWPMMEHAVREFAPHAWNKVSVDQMENSYTQMVEMVLDPLLALFLFALAIVGLSKLCFHCRRELRPRWLGRLANEQARPMPDLLPAHERTGVLLLIAYPVLGYVVASVHGGMLSPRFVIPVCFGFAIAGALVAFRIFGHLRLAGVTLLLVALAWFGVRESIVGYWYMEQKQDFYKVLNTLPKAATPNEPIAIPDPLLALTFRHYAPAELAARVVFPIDFPAIRLYRGDDSPEQNLWAGRGRIYHMQIVPLAAFERRTGKYLIIGSDGNWMVEDLLHHRYPVERLPIDTRATSIGGFTPLAHGAPVFYRSAGENFFERTPGYKFAPVPFRVAENLPGAKLTPEEGGRFWDDPER